MAGKDLTITAHQRVIVILQENFRIQKDQVQLLARQMELLSNLLLFASVMEIHIGQSLEIEILTDRLTCQTGELRKASLLSAPKRMRQNLGLERGVRTLDELTVDLAINEIVSAVVEVDLFEGRDR